MKRTLRLSLLVFAFATLASSAYPAVSTTTFNRLSGLIDIPTAEIVPDGTITFGLHGASDNRGGSGLDWQGSLYLGLARRAELGLTFLEPDEVLANIKFLVQGEEEDDLALALGVENIGREIPNLYGEEYQGEENSLYLVVGKRFGILKGLRAHLGIGNGRFVGHGKIISKHLSGIFTGIEKSIPLKGSTLAVMVEMDGRDVNAGARYTIPEGMSVDLAVTEIDNLLERHKDDGYNVTYSLGATWSVPGRKTIEAPRRPQIPIRERARLVEEEIVREGLVKKGLNRYLSCENLELNIIQREETPGFMRFYVRIKNIGRDAIYVNPNYFTLVNKDGDRFYYSPATFTQKRPLLGGRIYPGTEMEGTLIFPYSGHPGKLVFNDGWENLASLEIR